MPEFAYAGSALFFGVTPNLELVTGSANSWSNELESCISMFVHKINTLIGRIVGIYGGRPATFFGQDSFGIPAKYEEHTYRE